MKSYLSPKTLVKSSFKNVDKKETHKIDFRVYNQLNLLIVRMSNYSLICKVGIVKIFRLP